MNALSLEKPRSVRSWQASKGEAIDHAVDHRPPQGRGSDLCRGPLLTLYANRKPALKDARKRLEEAIEISRLPVNNPAIYDVIRWDDLQEALS